MNKLATLSLALAAVVCASLSSAEAEAGSPSIQWRFGIHVSLTHTHHGPGLLVESVDHHGPSANKLRRGDVILESNGVRFRNVRSDYGGIKVLQKSAELGVSGGGGLPTATARTYDHSHSRPALRSTVMLKILRNGRKTTVTVFPTYVGGGGGGGLPTAAF